MNQGQADQNLVRGTKIIWHKRTANNQNFAPHHHLLLQADVPENIEDEIVELSRERGGLGGYIELSDVPIGDSRFLRQMAMSLRPSGCAFREKIESPWDERRMYNNLGESSRVFNLSPGRNFEAHRMAADTPCDMSLGVLSSPSPLIDSPVRMGEMVQRLTGSVRFGHTSHQGTSFTRDLDQLLPELETMLDLIYVAATTKPNPNWKCDLMFVVPQLNQILHGLVAKMRQLGGIYNNHIVYNTWREITIGGAWNVATRTMTLKNNPVNPTYLHVAVN